MTRTPNPAVQFHETYISPPSARLPQASEWRSFTPRQSDYSTVSVVQYCSGIHIDDLELRQAIAKQLNKIELANRFTRAVAVGNPREFTQAEKEEQEIAEACNRLIGDVRRYPGGSEYACIFRDIRPPIPTTSAHLYRGIRPALTRCREALVFDISFLAFRHVVEGHSFGRIVRRVRAGRRCAPAGRGWHLRRWVHQ